MSTYRCNYGPWLSVVEVQRQSSQANFDLFRFQHSSIYVETMRSWKFKTTCKISQVLSSSILKYSYQLNTNFLVLNQIIIVIIIQLVIVLYNVKCKIV